MCIYRTRGGRGKKKKKQTAVEREREMHFVATLCAFSCVPTPGNCIFSQPTAEKRSVRALRLWFSRAEKGLGGYMRR